jgi:hypothetical protein
LKSTGCVNRFLQAVFSFVKDQLFVLETNQAGFFIVSLMPSPGVVLVVFLKLKLFVLHGFSHLLQMILDELQRVYPTISRRLAILHRANLTVFRTNVL